MTMTFTFTFTLSTRSMDDDDDRNSSSGKRSRKCDGVLQQNQIHPIILTPTDNDNDNDNNNNNSRARRRTTRRRMSIYQLFAFILGVLLVQLVQVRVHSWSLASTTSTSKSKSTIAKTTTHSSSTIANGDIRIQSSPPPPTPREFNSNMNSNSNSPLKMIMSSSTSQFRQRPSNNPSMLLTDDLFFPLSMNNALTSRSTSSGQSLSSSSSSSRIKNNANVNGSNSMFIKEQQQQRGAVLGFDVFELHSTRHRHIHDSSESTSTKSSTNENNNNNNNENNNRSKSSTLSFPAPGLTWKNSPLSTTNGYNSIGEPSSTATKSAGFSSSSKSKSAFSSASSSSSSSFGGNSNNHNHNNNNNNNNNGGVRLLRYSSPLLPAWFPWIPTKSQIMTLKVKELKEACAQRGLTKTGNKDVLQERLWGWTIEHQIQHQARLSGDYYLTNWFEQERHEEEKQGGNNNNNRKYNNNNNSNDNDGIDTTTVDPSSSTTPNSLAEWSRSVVDTEKLAQKRQEIHRQKRVGKKPPTDNDNGNDLQSSSSSSSRTNDNKNRNTKEYLIKLTNAMKASPSSPYASNKEVKELYDASKKADQLGEPLLAIQLLESLLEVTPNDARLYRRLSRMHNEQGNVNVARATLQKGLRKLPHNPWLWHGMGQLELSHGRSVNDYGIRCFQRAIKEDPAFAHSYHAWGIHEFSNGQIAKAMKIFKKGIEYCPTNHRLHHALGDLYRGAKLLKDAERSYRRALQEGPPVSHSFALSALACVAYEQGEVDEARRWLYRSIETNDGRHAQGWLALAQIEEAEGNIEKALTVCEASIIRYERGLIEARQRYKRGSRRMNHHPHNPHSNSSNSSSSSKGYNGQQGRHQPQSNNLDDKSFDDPATSKDIEKGLLKSIPKYRSGDKFLGVFRHWARLEGRYGTFDDTNRVYERAASAFPWNFKISLDWARYHVKLRNVERARTLFAEACSRASTHHADPYREYASFEMSLGQYEQARKILFRGAQALTRSSDGGLGNINNRRGLAQLYVTWAVCEWHLQNIPRVEVLFDHALRLTEVGSDEGSELRSFILFCIAQLEYYEREEYHLAQHCIGLCLKQNSLPGGNAPVWELWAEIAHEMGNSHLEEECLNEANRCNNSKEEEEEGSSALDTMNMLKGSKNMKHLMRQEPWHDKLQTVRGSHGKGHDSSSSSSSNFYSSIHIPNYRNDKLPEEKGEEEEEEQAAEDQQLEEAPVVVSAEEMTY